MGKTELIKAIASKCNVSSKLAAELLKAFTDIVTETVTEGETVTIPYFGSFALKEGGSTKRCHNPVTGEKMEIKTKPRIAFKCSDALKNMISKK